MSVGALAPGWEVLSVQGSCTGSGILCRTWGRFCIGSRRVSGLGVSVSNLGRCVGPEGFCRTWGGTGSGGYVPTGTEGCLCRVWGSCTGPGGCVGSGEFCTRSWRGTGSGGVLCRVSGSTDPGESYPDPGWGVWARTGRPPRLSGTSDCTRAAAPRFLSDGKRQRKCTLQCPSFCVKDLY